MSGGKFIPFDPKLKSRARELRSTSTLSEVLLWQQIKGRQIKGHKFLRQRPIDAYVVDFYSPELMMAIEVDGSTHDSKAEYDAIRQKRLESLGVKVLRIQDVDVKRNMEGVLALLRKCVEERETELSITPPLI